MTPLERAARALHKNYVENRIRMGVKPSDLPSWDELGSDGEASFYIPARAVIAAIREPSEAQIDATGEALIQPRDLRFSYGNIYRAMIDQLLEGEQR